MIFRANLHSHEMKWVASATKRFIDYSMDRWLMKFRMVRSIGRMYETFRESIAMTSNKFLLKISTKLWTIWESVPSPNSVIRLLNYDSFVHRTADSNVKKQRSYGISLPKYRKHLTACFKFLRDCYQVRLVFWESRTPHPLPIRAFSVPSWHRLLWCVHEHLVYFNITVNINSLCE